MVVVIFVLAVMPVAFAAESEQIVDTQRVDYANGDYLITTVTEVVAQTRAATQTRTGSRSSNYYNANNVLQWTVKVTGTFSYNGSSATCTNARASYSIADGNWKATSSAASKSGNTAVGEFTVKRYFLGVPVQTETVRLVLTCSPTGVLS